MGTEENKTRKSDTGDAVYYYSYFLNHNADVLFIQLLTELGNLFCMNYYTTSLYRVFPNDTTITYTIRTIPEKLESDIKWNSHGMWQRIKFAQDQQKKTISLLTSVEECS